MGLQTLTLPQTPYIAYGKGKKLKIVQEGSSGTHFFTMANLEINHSPFTPCPNVHFDIINIIIRCINDDSEKKGLLLNLMKPKTIVLDRNRTKEDCFINRQQRDLARLST